MNILFVHNNFPAQFRHLVARLNCRPDVNIAAIGSHTAMPMPGVRLVKYALPGGDLSQTHPFARRFDLECRRAEQVLYGLSNLVAGRFKPDLIFAHPGWGESLPLRTMFSDARFLLYCEYCYGAPDGDLGFDPEFPTSGLDGRIALRLKNATTLLALAECDLGVSPTLWQRSTFPEHYRSKIEVVHDGVECSLVKPDRDAALTLPSGQRLKASDEVVTFVARNLEPVRGYHVFMRSLPSILERRSNAQVIIVGGDGTSYGPAAPEGTTWKSMFLTEVESRIDLRRVHFLGQIPYDQYLKVLQVSTVHVYMTYPFVLSWSVLEAMSAGCVVIGSDIAPVREVIDGRNGLLVPFFDIERWSDRVIHVLENRDRYTAMRRKARHFVETNFDADAVTVPKMMEILQLATSFKQAQSKSGRTAAKRQKRVTLGTKALRAEASRAKPVRAETARVVSSSKARAQRRKAR